MKNESDWKPSKYVFDQTVLRASRDPGAVAVSSRLHVDLVAQALQATVKKHGRGRLLDLGCGKVPLYALYKPLVQTITCADWPQSQHPLYHVDQDCDLTQLLPFADRQFDTVILTDVLEHIPTPHELLTELNRILDADGVLIGSVPFLYRLHEEPHDYFRYTAHAIKRLAGGAGFTVLHLEPYGGGMDVICDLLAKLVVDVHWRFGPLMARVIQRGGAKFRRLEFGASYSGQRSDMPLGYSFVMAKGSR